MGVVTQLYDPEGDSLIARAKAFGEENLSRGERERLQITLDRRRKQEANAAQPRATDALAAERVADVESRLIELKAFVIETLTQMVGEAIGEAEGRSFDHAKRLVAELRDEINAKSDALFSGFEQAVVQLRDEDRRALFENLRETLGDAESRIDASLARVVEAEKERNTLELALVRDELLNVIGQKTFAQFDDDAPKLKLAEKAIAGLRKRMTSLEEQAARGDQLAGLADRFAALEDAYRKSTKSLLVRCAANHLAAKKEAERADELAGKVEHLEKEFQRLTDALLDQKVIR
jgi:flagellar basal body-associated protein FliL